MELTINGEKREFTNNSKLKEIMALLQIEEKVMACAVNMQIIKKEKWGSHTLNDGDKIEMLHFVGGG